MELTEKQNDKVDRLVEDTLENPRDSEEFIIACVREHYEKEVMEN